MPLHVFLLTARQCSTNPLLHPWLEGIAVLTSPESQASVEYCPSCCFPRPSSSVALSRANIAKCQNTAAVSSEYPPAHPAVKLPRYVYSCLWRTVSARYGSPTSTTTYYSFVVVARLVWIVMTQPCVGYRGTAVRLVEWYDLLLYFDTNAFAIFNYCKTNRQKPQSRFNNHPFKAVYSSYYLLRVVACASGCFEAE